jgi:hypothetical protein
MDWRKLLSVEVLLFAVGSLVAFAVAWADVKADIAVLQSTDQQQQQIQTERYEDLKEGQKELRRLMQQLLGDSHKHAIKR